MTRAVIQSTEADSLSVAGIPLLARTVLSLWSVGVRVFTVVGASPTAVASATGDIERVARDIKLHWVDSVEADPERVSAARVIVARADGIFAAPAAARLVAQARLSNVWLRFSGNDGGGLKLFSAANYVADRAGHNVTCDLLYARGEDFHRVHGPEDIGAAERRLFSWCTKQTDGIVSRAINRPISTWFSRHLSHFDIRPRELTGVTAVLALTTFTALMNGTLLGLVMGCVLYQITSVVDGLDGEIARAKYMASRTGAALDTGVDMASNLLFMIGISLGSAAVFGQTYLWMGVFIAATASTAIIVMTMVLKFGPGGGSFDVLQLTIEQRLVPYPRVGRVFVVVHSAFKRDLFALLFAILGVARMPEVIPWLLAGGTSIWLVTILLFTPTMLRANREDILPPHLQTGQLVTANVKAQRDR